MTREELIQYASFCHSQAIMINQDLYIVRQIQELAGKYKEEIEISPAFYTMILDSLEKAIVIGLAKLYDNNNQQKPDRITIQISGLLEQIQNNIEWFPKVKQIKASYSIEFSDGKISNLPEHPTIDIPLEPEKELQTLTIRKTSLDAIIKKLRNLRNKIYAHNDKKILLGKQENWIEKNSFSLDDAEMLIILAFDVSDFVIKRLAGECRERKAVNIDDFEKTLRYVQIGRKQWKQEIEKFLNKVLNE